MKTLVILLLVASCRLAMAQAPVLPDAVIGDFTQYKHEPGLEKALSTKGHFVFDKHSGLLWRLHGDEKILWIPSDGRAQSLINGRWAKTKDRSLQRMQQVINSIIQQDWARLKKRFTIEQSQHENYFHLRLMPKQNKVARFVSSIDVVFDDFLESIIIKTPDHAELGLLFSQQQHQPRINVALCHQHLGISETACGLVFQPNTDKS